MESIKKSPSKLMLPNFFKGCECLNQSSVKAEVATPRDCFLGRAGSFSRSLVLLRLSFRPWVDPWFAPISIAAAWPTKLAEDPFLAFDAPFVFHISESGYDVLDCRFSWNTKFPKTDISFDQLVQKRQQTRHGEQLRMWWRPTACSLPWTSGASTGGKNGLSGAPKLKPS